MPDDRDKLSEDDAQEDDDSAEDVELEEADAEDADADDDVAPSKRQTAQTGGGSGWVTAVVIIVVLVIAVVVGHTFLKKQQAAKEAAIQTQIDEAAGTLSRVQASVNDTLARLEQDEEPDVDGAVRALNDAARDLNLQVQSTSTVDADRARDLAQQMIDLQSMIKDDVIKGLRADQNEYREAVKTARDKLRSSATDRTEGVVRRLSLLTTATYGDADTPTLLPSSRGTEEEAKTDEGGEGGTEATSANEESRAEPTEERTGTEEPDRAGKADASDTASGSEQ